jgi:hypothetical protein
MGASRAERRKVLRGGVHDRRWRVIRELRGGAFKAKKYGRSLPSTRASFSKHSSRRRSKSSHYDTTHSPVLYEVRNNRGVGHVGGDVDPNFLDVTAVFGMASWVLAELVRIFHDVSTELAQAAVDALIERKHPLIWEVGDMHRVLDPKMEKRDQALLLLHQRSGWVSDEDLLNWVEYSRIGNFRKAVLRPFHAKRLVEYDEASKRVRISPLGVQVVEREILKTRAYASFKDKNPGIAAGVLHFVGSL